MIAHLLFVRRAKAGLVARPRFRLPGSPVTELATLAFLAAVVVLMYFDDEGAGHLTVLCTPLIALALVIGWFCVRGRVQAVRQSAAPAVSAED